MLVREITNDKTDKRLWHKAKKGETDCMYCGQDHDDVEIGKCPALVGIHAPRRGETFIGIKGDLVVARFDFIEQKFPVLDPFYT